MEDGIHAFCEIQYYLRALRCFCYFSGGNLEEESNLVYMDIMPVLTSLFMKESLCCCLLCDRVVHPYSLYRFSTDTDLVNPVTRRPASFWVYSSV